MATIIVKNNESRVRTFPNGVRLNPDVQEVDAKLWSDLQKGSEFQKLLQPASEGEKPVLQVLGGGAQGAAPKSFEEMDAAQQAELVSETTDRDLLAKWSKSAKSTESKKAIDDRLAEVSLSDDEKKAAAEKKSGAKSHR